MGQDIELGCRCGAIHGWAKSVSPTGVYRTVCYCDDCQAFLHFLGRSELLNDHGGTDIVQVPPTMIAFDRGCEHIVALRLADKGMYRWYANCCKTPLGNTLKPSVPFIGMPLEVFRGAPDVAQIDELFGKPRISAMTRYAVGGAPEGSSGFPAHHLLKILAIVLRWKYSGKAWPHPFFDKATRTTKYPVTVLRSVQREALRSKCGPSPHE